MTTVLEKTRQSLITQRSIDEEKQMLHCSTIIAVRLLAMVNIGSLPHEIPNSRIVPWKDGSLADSIHEHFRSPQEFDAAGVLLESDFTARNFQKIAGLEVVWTDNLADHLRLIHSDTKVFIFHHTTFLRWMKHTNSPLYPVRFIQETLETLTLLFPSKDRKARRWLEEQISDNGRVDLKLKEAGSMKRSHQSRRLGHYKFWRDRLGALQEAYDEATPPSKALLKALTDRKRGDSWINSWVAIVAICFTLFFGLVQSVEGAIQVYKAYHGGTN